MDRSLRISWLGLLLYLVGAPTLAGEVELPKQSVVRIVNAKIEEQGTGFVVKTSANEIYIITASHVVSGAEFHDVYFSSRATPVQGRVFNREEDALKGLALIVVKRETTNLPPVTAIDLGRSTDLKGGEVVQTIGFPEGAKISSVGRGTFTRLEGRSVVLSGKMKRGDSGGPVILNEVAVGLVTDVMEGSGTVYAVQSESIVLYLNGCGIKLEEKDVQPNENALEHAARGGEHWQRAMTAGNWEIYNAEMMLALVEYRIAESEYPKNPLFRINTGTVLNRLGRYEEAVVKLREGVKLDPTVAWFHNELCVALKMLKRFEEADPECLAAIKFDKNNAAFQDKLIQSLERADKKRAQPN